MESLATLKRRNHPIGIGGGKADHTRLGGDPCIGASCAEMRGTNDADRADAAFARQFDGLIHGDIGRVVAESVVAVHDGRGDRGPADRHARRAVDPAAPQHAVIMNHQPHAVTVHPDARGVHHRPHRCSGRVLCSAGLAQRVFDSRFEQIRGN